MTLRRVSPASGRFYPPYSLKLLKESEYHEMSYLEKRRKDRKFGQMVKTATKHDKRKSQ